jgi:hypothetical protein
MSFKIKIEPEVFDDIQNGIAWYNKQQAGLGKRFLSEVKLHINLLKTNPFFQIRYDKTKTQSKKDWVFSFKGLVIKIIFSVYKNESSVQRKLQQHP